LLGVHTSRWAWARGFWIRAGPTFFWYARENAYRV
jgi:hypothetical protein